MTSVVIKKERFWLLDTLRSFCILNMILYHGLWDCAHIFSLDMPWFHTKYAYFWQQMICWSFILLSGFCWSLGRRHLLRGGIVFCGGVLVTLVTAIFLPEQLIIFGILTFLGSSMVLLIPLYPFLKKVPPGIGVIGSFFLFVFSREINVGFWGFEKWRFGQLPEWLYQNYFTAFWGFPMESFSSSDYFPFFPWFFLFLSGFYLYRLLMEKQQIKTYLKKGALPGITWLGQHSLLLYLLHQPIIYFTLSVYLA